MAVNFSPWGNQQIVDENGDPAVGWKIWSYVAGSSTPLATYTDNTGGTAQSNPIVINSLGFPTTGQIWLTSGSTYKLVLTDENDVVQKTEDNIKGLNDFIATGDEWIASGLTPTYISATSFSVAGDQSSILNVGRRLKTTNTGGTVYSTISASVFSSVTTVTVVNDSGTLDSGLSAVSYGIVNGANSSIPVRPDVIPIVSDITDPTKRVRLDAGALTTATVRVITMPDENVTLNLAATTSVAGISELATQAEMDAGTASKVPTTDLNKVTLGTPVATTSGTTISFTGIPAGVRRITLNFVGVSTNGTSVLIVQLGDGGGIEISGYLGATAMIIGATSVVQASNRTDSFPLDGTSAGHTRHGCITFILTNAATFTWVVSGVLGFSDVANVVFIGGSKSLSSELTQLRLTTVNGTDTFDAGSVNITYER